MKLLSEDSVAVITIRGEAEGEPYDGKCGVGEVIRRRADTKFYSAGDIISACLFPLQFSCWNARSPNRLRIAASDDTDPNVQECQKAWVASASTNLTNGAVMYHAQSILPPWVDEFEFTVQIGHHLFYKEKV